MILFYLKIIISILDDLSPSYASFSVEQENDTS